MKNIYIVFILFLIGSFNTAFAQSGILAGNVLDGEYNNEPMAFANILVKGTTTGTTSDFDGKYQLELDSGTYTIIFSFVGYETKEISNVVIKSGQVTDLDVTLSSNSLETVVITQTVKRNTENAALALQKKSATLLDAMSAQTIKASGAGNLASAVKSVPGVSVEGGKYVYVRGLGDRYTKSTLNGVDIPGLDPDRNTIQMDIFPTNILDNIVVVKSAAAEYPADFTGGVVDIITKDFPTKFEASVSIGAGFNPDMHGKDNFLIGSGSDTDFWGYDDGTRNVPINRYQRIPGTFDNRNLLNSLTGRFDSELRAQEETSKPNFDFGFTLGDQFEVGENNKLGYMALFSYKNSTTFYENRVDGAFSIDALDKSNNNLLADRISEGREGINNVLVNGLAGLTFKTQRSKYKVNILHIQNGESAGGIFNQLVAGGGSGSGSGLEPISKDAITYTERSITNLLINGNHRFGAENDWTFDWKLSPTFSKVHDKDHKVTPLQETDEGEFDISPSFATFPIRIWRFLQEENWASKFDFTKKYEIGGRPAKLKFGGGYTYKFRDFSIDDWTFQNNEPVADGNPNNFLAPENLWSRDNPNGTNLVSTDQFNPGDAYEGEQNIGATYISNEFNITEKLKTILGLRAEIFTSYYTGRNNSTSEDFLRRKVLDEHDFFPSANLIYALTEESNLRGSYYRTTARPSFKEASFSRIYDPITDRLFIGNINLVPTYVNNFDLRYERFGEGGEMFAISGFFKKFKDPIEQSFFAQASTQLTYGNLGNADVYGAEIEFRRNLGFISEELSNLKFTLNASYTKSELTMSDGEFDSRVANARDGQTIERKRDMQGQAPFLINSSLNYTNSDLGLQTGLFFNIQGKTLQVVGLGGIPDVYTKPFESLNFTFNKTFGENKRSAIDFKINNILGAEKESVFESFKAEDRVYSLRQPGTEFSLGYTLKF
ncbi:TonB-dependent receptor [Seonamhaeicola marinus]|uniref:TonB-dependent receptor plug domain-containing protein n=1 Tax=Seonamhaeicola marinus TaxID=1912246 RepID=A0A5D0HU84_9FLAO|nr:TonB-dependent receptor [Seonamhaeicola marinus]TYA74470.1 TonB-dependent receptor plug domain-containing protein [Seonamhaeicola marinus]